MLGPAKSPEAIELNGESGMQRPKAPDVTDPRHEIERYANNVGGIYGDAETIQVVFTVFRPVAGTDLRGGTRTEDVVVSRIRFPRSLARALGERLVAMAGGAEKPIEEVPRH